MANEHPFQHLFETLGRIPAFHSESVNRQAYEVLSDILSVPVEKSGRCILLRAPRAGHGKTHLLSRIQHQLGASHEFIPLHASFGCRIDAATVIDDTLRRLVRQLPASGGLCVLDLVTRRLFASALQPLVSSGEVPCQDREGALAALRMRPIETFDFHHPNAVTAHWARENFEVLGQRLGLELAQRAGLPVREVSFWVDLLFRFASAPLENTSRVRLLAEAAHGASAEEMERLEALLGLMTLLMRVILVADDLEGFSTDETAALRLAAFLGQLRQSVDRLDVILSLNQDIWQSAFVPRLSGGLADRLSEVVVELEPLKESEMAALLDSRVPGLGGRVLEKIDKGSAGTHARGLIRAAGMAWLKATAMDSTPSAVVESPPEVPVVETPLPPIVPTIPPSEPVPVAEPAPVPVPEPAFKAPVEEPEVPPSPEPRLVAVDEPVPAPAPEPPPSPFFAAEADNDQPPAIEKTEPEVASAFTFSSETVPPADVPATWPVPEFAPAPELAPAGEDVVASPAAVVAESPFQIEPAPPTSISEPILTPAEPVPPVLEPTLWPPPVAGAHALPAVEAKDLWDLPDDDIVPSQTASPFQAPVSSPFEAAPAPQEIAVQSDVAFQTEAQPDAPVFTPPPVPEISPQPAAFPPPGWQDFHAPPSPAPETVPTPAAVPFEHGPSPFSAVPSPVEAALSRFEEVPSAGTFQAQPAASPFQAAPMEQPPAQPVPAFQAAPVEPPPVPAPSPFQVTPEPEVAAPAASAEQPKEQVSDTDRVDDLLRQFRERYGRGSL